MTEAARLTINQALRSERLADCVNCGSFVRITGYLNDERGPFAPYIAELHCDRGLAEAWITVILGTWGHPEPPVDHVTFACRVGEVEGHASPMATLATPALDESPYAGALLGRQEALDHPLLPTFWMVVDHILMNDMQVQAHLAKT